MSDTPSQQRLARLNALIAEANRLQPTSGLDDSLKAELQLASHDLEEAALYLGQPYVDTEPAILTNVDMALEVATYRINVVKKAIALFGADAAEVRDVRDEDGDYALCSFE
jgi:hypothetical protein